MSAGEQVNPILEATETSPTTDKDVRDFDELPERDQHALPDAVDADTVTIPEPAAEAFDDGEVVRFTGYYRVTIAR